MTGRPGKICDRAQNGLEGSYQLFDFANILQDARGMGGASNMSENAGTGDNKLQGETAQLDASLPARQGGFRAFGAEFSGAMRAVRMPSASLIPLNTKSNEEPPKPRTETSSLVRLPFTEFRSFAMKLSRGRDKQKRI